MVHSPCRETCAGYWNRVRHRYQSRGPHVTLNLEFAKRTCAASNRYWAGLITRCRQGQFLLKTYHEVAQPIVLLRNLRASLSPRAKVGVIDRNGNGENHGVAYQLLEQDDFRQGRNGLFSSFWRKIALGQRSLRDQTSWPNTTVLTPPGAYVPVWDGHIS